MADTFLFSATAIYQATHYVFDDVNTRVIDLNAPRIGGFSPRNVWLLRYIVPGQNQIQYELTFEPTSDQLADTNTLQGLYVEQDGLGVMIDCISIANFNAVANGTLGGISPRYGAPPAFTTPTALYWCVTRSDDGTESDHSNITSDYVGQYIGNMRMVGNVTGVSTYRFQAYGTPKAIGSDVLYLC